jgi:lipopolysaccharide/colanic/teichoic acid biosynthesis glycosyltransferase
METLAPKQAPLILSRRGYQQTKRVLDLVICLLIMPLAAVVMAAISVAILLDSSGPVFFRQERVGRCGRRFRMYKFRTLRHNHDDASGREFMKAYIKGEIGQDDNDGGQVVYKPIHKTHVTRLGRILRKTSLDELPQILNVLKGEMSLVGPRPHVPWEVQAYSDWHCERLRVLPGITGLAQVWGRSGISFNRLVRYDLKYVQEQSLKLDLKILCWTLLSVLKGRGAA